MSNVRVIDPSKSNPDDENIIGILLAQMEGDNPSITKIRKSESKKANKQTPTYQVNGQEFKLTHSLLKIGDEYWVIDKEIGKGSDTKVKLLPIYYKKVDDKFQKQVSEEESIVKVFSLSEKDKKNDKNNQNWEKLKEAARHEIKMLREAADDKNANIVVDEARKKIYIKAKKIQGISLDKYLAANPGLSLDERKKLMKLIGEVVLELHKKGFCHLDLKPENILFNPEKNQINLIDFGSTQPKNANLNQIASHLHATTKWFNHRDHALGTAAPEQLDNYALAGIFGIILNSENKDYLQSPIFAVKKQWDMGFGAFLANPNPNKRCYNFEVLKTNENAEIVEDLKKLGEEELSKQMKLSDFMEKLTRDIAISARQSSSANIISATSLAAIAKTKKVPNLPKKGNVNAPPALPKKEPAQQSSFFQASSESSELERLAKKPLILLTYEERMRLVAPFKERKLDDICKDYCHKVEGTQEIYHLITLGKTLSMDLLIGKNLDAKRNTMNKQVCEAIEETLGVNNRLREMQSKYPNKYKEYIMHYEKGRELVSRDQLSELPKQGKHWKSNIHSEIITSPSLSFSALLEATIQNLVEQHKTCIPVLQGLLAVKETEKYVSKDLIDKARNLVPSVSLKNM